MPNAAYNEVDALQEQATALIQELRRAVRLRQAALAAGDETEAAAWAGHIQNVARAYNVTVQRLYELEGPSTTLKFLDRVGDVIISGVKTGATMALEFAGDAAGAAGSAVARAILPVAVPVVVLLVVLVLAVGKSGIFRARVAV